MTRPVGQLQTYRNPGGIVPERIDWRAVVGCWQGFAHPGRRVTQMYGAVLALAAAPVARSYFKARAHPHGRMLMSDRPDLLAVLNDDTYLASLPEGSLGRAYRDHLAVDRLDAAVFDEAAVIRPAAERGNWSEDFYYLAMRATLMHDLLHVLCEYGADMAGEIAMFGFHCGQMEPAGLVEKWGNLLALAVPGGPPHRRLRFYRQAVERGRRADRLLAAPWETLLDKPIEEVRAQLGIFPLVRSHPQGVWHTSWTPSGAR